MSQSFYSCTAFKTGVAVAVALAVFTSPVQARAWNETVLHTFAGGSDGQGPTGNLIADQSGNLFGTTVDGGGGGCHPKGCGTVFKVSPDGTETVLYAFHGVKDGKRPVGGLLFDQAGNLYGTTAGGGGRGGGGTIYEVTQSGVHTVLYTFSVGIDGFLPVAGLIADQSGNLYGTTAGGGTNFDGTVFELTPSGYAVLYSFQGKHDGADPQGPLAFDVSGNLYGTTLLGGGRGCGGGNGCGTVFKLAPDGTETVFHAFRGGRHGTDPSGWVVFDSTGNLYGMTAGGGGEGCFGSGCGTVFEIAPDGTETILSRFNRPGGPAQPEGGVIRDNNGNLFGTSHIGGAAGCGTVFKLIPGHDAKALYSFTCGKDGAYPLAGLFMDPSGNLYGTTLGGGSRSGQDGDGVVFELKK